MESVEKEDFKPGMKSEGVMDDEGGESVEPMGEMPPRRSGASEM